MVKQETQGNIAILTLDSPPVNALDTHTFEQLDQALIDIEHSEAQALILTGDGRCFCAGLNLKSVRRMDIAKRRELVAALNRCFERLYSFPRPVVAALNGHAIAGGMVLALAADYRLCVEAPIKIGLAEVRVGIPFPMGAMAIVQNELDQAGFRQFALLGINTDPQGARRYGVIDEVVAADRLMIRAQEIAREAGELPAKAFNSIKLQARSAALERIRTVIETDEDPVFESWDMQFPR